MKDIVTTIQIVMKVVHGFTNVCHHSQNTITPIISVIMRVTKTINLMTIQEITRIKIKKKATFFHALCPRYLKLNSDKDCRS